MYRSNLNIPIKSMLNMFKNTTFDKNHIINTIKRELFKFKPNFVHKFS